MKGQRSEFSSSHCAFVEIIEKSETIKSSDPHAPKPFKFFKFDETAAKRNFDWFTRHPWPRWLHQHLNQRSLLMTIVVVRRREKRILWTLLFLLCVWHPWLNAKHVLFNCPPWLIKLLLKQKCWGVLGSCLPSKLVKFTWKSFTGRKMNLKVES